MTCLLVSGARLILFINIPGDLEHQSRLLMSYFDLPAAHHHRHCPNQTLPLSSRLYQLDGFSEENPRESDTESKGQSPQMWWGPQHPQTLPSPFKRLPFCHSTPPWGPLPCVLSRSSCMQRCDFLVWPQVSNLAPQRKLESPHHSPNPRQLLLCPLTDESNCARPPRTLSAWICRQQISN